MNANGCVINTWSRMSWSNRLLSYWQTATHLLPGKKVLSLCSYSINRSEPGSPPSAHDISPVTLRALYPSWRAFSVSVDRSAIILSGSKTPSFMYESETVRMENCPFRRYESTSRPASLR
ncbi:MAG: hypothetical protein A4E37_00348 [Methanoregulaceae archaeon PtaB.Bin056]|nr:MAG: hypothetical protein A4E37_00348 [Methanoregulaceae archaeon PtaB.Bin056]